MPYLLLSFRTLDFLYLALEEDFIKFTSNGSQLKYEKNISEDYVTIRGISSNEDTHDYIFVLRRYAPQQSTT